VQYGRAVLLQYVAPKSFGARAVRVGEADVLAARVVPGRTEAGVVLVSCTLPTHNCHRVAVGWEAGRTKCVEGSNCGSGGN
jgi:hypothetical protein